MRLNSPEEIIQILNENNNNVSLISFDVFDTLLRRDIAPPERTKIPALKQLKTILSKSRINISIQDLLKKRNKAENAIGNSLLDKGFDWDCPIEDVMEHLLNQFSIGKNKKKLVEKLIDVEIEAEKSVVYPEPGMLEALKHAARLNRKMIWISDMYLKKEHIDILLDTCGYKNLFHNGYVSSEIKQRKKTGSLYHHVLKELEIDPSKWIHFGDNREDDFIMPQKIGGKSYHYYPSSHKKFSNDVYKFEKLSKSNSAWTGASIMVNLEKRFIDRYEDKRLNNLAYKIGFTLLGPLFINFIHHVIEKVNKEDIRLVLFPAREGFILQNIFEKFRPLLNDRNNVVSKYCYLTRKTTFQASITKIGKRELKKGFSHTSEPSIKLMLNRFGISIDSVQHVLTDCNISSVEQIIEDPLNSEQIQRLLNHDQFIDIVKQNSIKHKIILEKYLKQINFLGCGKVSIIDVGWQGTVQDALTNAFGDHKEWPHLFGYYMGFLGADYHLQTPSSVYEGLIYERRNKEHSNVAFRKFLQLFEIATRAHHGTIVNLVEDKHTKKVIPELKKENDKARLLELEDSFLITSIQSGILDCVDEVMQMVPFLYGSASKFTPFVLKNINRLIQIPTREEGLLFNQFVNIEDFGNDNVLKAEDINLLSLTNPNILWKEGFVASKKFPFLVWLYNLYKIFRYG